jgi:hypothetical protein
VVGTQQFKEMENDSVNILKGEEPRDIEAAGEDGEWDTNTSNRLTAPEASERRETKELCPMDTAESTRARETTVPEERSAAVRRDGIGVTLRGANWVIR